MESFNHLTVCNDWYLLESFVINSKCVHKNAELKLVLKGYQNMSTNHIYLNRIGIKYPTKVVMLLNQSTPNYLRNTKNIQEPNAEFLSHSIFFQKSLLKILIKIF